MPFQVGNFLFIEVNMPRNPPQNVIVNCNYSSVKDTKLQWHYVYESMVK